MKIETLRLDLVPKSLQEIRTEIDAMSPDDQAELSADWISLLDSATSESHWVLGFKMVRRDDGVHVGQCGFKGPPSIDGVVEIAYAVEPDMECNGYATEAAHGLTRFAFQHDTVVLVRAHTLPKPNASGRVLTKCGFRFVGEVTDPDDGPVWRWEKVRDQ